MSAKARIARERAQAPWWLRPRRGGAREGAGRKPVARRRWVRRDGRERFPSSCPVHVTMKLEKGLPSLRRKRTHYLLLACFEEGNERFGFRLTHFSIQGNHLHLICEAKDRRALARGIQGLSVRIARGLNRLWKRSGRVFADRYHSRALRSARQVRNAICYVLHNSRKHGVGHDGPCLYASGWWFDGWKEKPRLHVPDDVPRPVAAPRTWLLGVGWRRFGLIRLDEGPKNSLPPPGGAARRARRQATSARASRPE